MSNSALFVVVVLFFLVVFGLVFRGLSKTPRNASIPREGEFETEKWRPYVYSQPVNSEPQKTEVAPAVELSDEAVNLNRRKAIPPLELIYLNTRDQHHRRIVQPFRARANRDYFEAYCHLEESKRSFRFDRVLRATDLQTGEVFGQAALYMLVHPKRVPPARLIVDPIDEESLS